jgi:hypothetical protein
MGKCVACGSEGVASRALERYERLPAGLAGRGCQRRTLVPRCDVDDSQYSCGPSGEHLCGGGERAGERIGRPTGTEVLE